MLKTKTVITRWNANNKKHLLSKGYNYTNYNDEIEINVEDLTRYSTVKVIVICDDCKKELVVPYSNYLTNIHNDGKYYCTSCACKFGEVTKRNKALKNGAKSFEQWCIENNELDLLNRWDYELNKLLPSQITYGTHRKYYFKCPCKNPLHKSELKNIHNYTTGHEGVMDCVACNSIGQVIVDEYGFDNLYNYWDKENNIDPFTIFRTSQKKYKFICNHKNYHSSYEMTCANFTNGARCPYCHGLKTHPMDSLGKYLKDNQIENVWSDKNKLDPFTIQPNCHKELFWKCNLGLHKDYKRTANRSYVRNFKCPACEMSHGEMIIMNFLDRNDIAYEPQKRFQGLVGVGNYPLSYDFYLPDFNLLIEAQGQQHERPVDIFGGEEKFEIQQEHDKRKRDYAVKHNLELFEIWYDDFTYENIYQILNRKLTKTA